MKRRSSDSIPTEDLAQRANLNLWDCFSPVHLADGRVELFGDRNIGRMELTDMQVANLLPLHTRGRITNWYARTNVLEHPMPERIAKAWHGWKHMTTATLYVGDHPVLYRPLADILGPRDGAGGIGGHDLPELADVRESYAVAMAHAYAKRVMEGLGADHAAQRVGAEAYWRALTDAQRAAWLDAVGVMRAAAQPIAIPPRARFRVQIDTHMSSLTSLLGVMPGEMAAQVLVWIHLDGLRMTDLVP